MNGITNDVPFPEFVNYALHWGYLGIFLWFITVDQLTPFPEEITLLTIGYLSANGVFNPVIAAAVCVCSFVIVDVVYFALARSGSPFIRKLYEKNPIARKYESKFRHNMGRSFVVLCFIPRMRMFGPILVGLLRLSFLKFLIIDTLVLMAFSVLYISIGEIFHRSLQYYLEEFEVYRHLIFAVATAIVAVILVIVIFRRRAAGNG